MNDFMVSFNLFGEFDNFEDWDAAEEEKRKEYENKEMWHKEVTPEELNNLEEDKDEVNTKKTTKWAVKTLRDFLAQKNMDINFESYTLIPPLIRPNTTTAADRAAGSVARGGYLSNVSQRAILNSPLSRFLFKTNDFNGIKTTLTC